MDFVDWFRVVGGVLLVLMIGRWAYIATHPDVRLRLDAQLEYERSRRKGWDEPDDSDAGQPD